MTVNQFYVEELETLRTLGRELSLEYPSLFPFLSSPGEDPDVERLLEGVAFLTGRLRFRLQEELPELSHSLAHLLWPNYLRPFPSCGIVIFDSKAVEEKNSVVPRNVCLKTRDDEYRDTCTFTTCYPVTVRCIEVFRTVYNTSGLIELHLRKKANGSITLPAIFRFYLGVGDRVIGLSLLMLLCSRLERIELFFKGSGERMVLSADCLKPVGFSFDEALLPSFGASFDGYRLIQEYFLFKEKFLFIDVDLTEGIRRFGSFFSHSGDEVVVRFFLSKALPPGKEPGKDHFLLNAAPVVNIYEADGHPITYSEEREEYLITPERGEDVFAVTDVRGWNPLSGREETIHPFESFKSDTIANQGLFYTTCLKTHVSKGFQTFIRFTPYDDAVSSGDLFKEVIALRLFVTDGNRPATIPASSLSVPTEEVSGDICFHGIGFLTPSIPPPLGGDLLWRLISNASLNYLSLGDVKTLRSIIETYDFKGAFDETHRRITRRTLSGLKGIKLEREEMIFKGLPIRGSHSTIEVDVECFSSTGEAYLLGSVLNRFLNLYESINSYHRLTMNTLQGDSFEWEPFRTTNTT